MKIADKWLQSFIEILLKNIINFSKPQSVGTLQNIKFACTCSVHDMVSQ